jgi:hypothetical protein
VYLRKYAAEWKSTVDVALGAPKVVTRPASFEMSVGVFTGPQRKLPTKPPVEEDTAGTVPDASTSLTVIAGDSENAIFRSSRKLNYMRVHNTIIFHL